MTAELDADRSREARQTEPFWSRWLDRLVGALRGFSAPRLVETAEGHAPIFRIALVSDDCWVVERPGAVMEHAFPDLERAVAFIRKEGDTLATVELRIGDLYVVARFDPRQPDSLFGELVP